MIETTAVNVTFILVDAVWTNETPAVIIDRHPLVAWRDRQPVAMMGSTMGYIACLWSHPVVYISVCSTYHQLFCVRLSLGFSSNRKKRMKQLKKKVQRGLWDPNVDDPFELFVTSTKIRYCYYKETDLILGQTFGMCILQDFEAITPNILCRTVETVEGNS